MRTPSGLRIDSPSWPLLQAHISYWGITSAVGSALGNTIVDAQLANEPSYDGLVLKILSGGAAGQARTIQVHAGNTVTVGVAFTNSAGAVQQIAAGTRYVILTSLAGGGGPGPSPEESLTYYGVVTAVPGANQFTIPSLAGLGAGKFAGVTNPYAAFVLRDAGGASAAPQGEIQNITAYVTGTGVFTTGAFTAAVAVGDEILIIHPSLASLLIAPVVIASGTLDTSSATVPADSTRTEGNDYFNGSILMTLTGAVRLQPRPILDYTGAGGIFTLDPSVPFTAATGLVPYVVLRSDFPLAVGLNTAATLYSSAAVLADRDGDIQHRLEWIIAMLSGDIPVLPSLIETWQDVLGIDFTVWTTAITGTGAVARSVAEEPFQKVILTGPANADTARIRSVQQWQVGPDTWGTDTIIRRLVKEWEARFVLVASIENATFFMGLANIAAATRASTNIAGFILVGDALNCITDDGVGETVTAVAGPPVLTTWHKYRIDIDTARIRFYVDEVLVATHVANLPDVNSFVQFYLPQEAAANGGELHVSTVSVRPSGIL